MVGSTVLVNFQGRGKSRLATGVLLALGNVSAWAADDVVAAVADHPVPLVHQTDLFRPHGDPDDHFDLACVYALAQRKLITLEGVLCDFPPPRRVGDPDVAAVAMLNHLTGLNAPLVVGMPQNPAGVSDRLDQASTSDLGGVNWLLHVLRTAPEPVAIDVAGSAKDVAVAFRREPQLFAAKCRAIYLNSGTGANAADGARLEFNVNLDPASYATLFDLPCPLYWLPCYDHLDPHGPDPRTVMRHGTFYQFPMSAVLPHLSGPLQNFFLSMLTQDAGTHWLRTLRAAPDAKTLATWGRQARNMWCTAGYFQMAGLGVTGDGTVAPLSQTGARFVYRFVPVRVTCSPDGHTRWEPGESNPPRYKFEVVDLDRYGSAMTTALRDLLQPLGANYVAAPPPAPTPVPVVPVHPANELKWHPGHYAFVQFSALREEHIYANFRGIQKTYTWRELEPEPDRYDFSAIRADLAFLGKHDRRLVIQVQTKTFGPGQNYCPEYLAGPAYGGGVYKTRWGSFNPIIWDERVNRRLNALYAQLGKELDREPFLEAVVIPESATTFDVATQDELHYTVEKYIRSVESGMQALKDAFPTTVVIQYVNMPPEATQALAAYAQAHGVGFGGPDIYPYDPQLTNPQRGVYRLYAPLSGSVPLGAAVQQNDYTQRAAFRGAAGETPVQEIYEFGRDTLRLNYIFWGTRQGYFEKVQAMLADPSFPKDPAGGLHATRPLSVGERTNAAVGPDAQSSLRKEK
jgi:hypothetical protein